MYLKRKLLLIFLITLPGVSGETVENGHCAASRKMDEQCSRYCYKIVKPLLQYAASVQSKESQFGELTSRNQNHEATIKSLEDQLQLSKSQQHFCLTKDELFDKIESAIVTKNDNIERLIKELKNIDAKDDGNVMIKELEKKIKELTHETVTQNMHAEDLNAELRKKDAEILSLKSRNIEYAAKIKQLEGNVEAKDDIMTSCRGRGTGIFKIQVTCSKPFEVSCDSSLADSGWTVIQRRQDGSENFNRTMSDYRSGFGTLTNEFFLGLDKIYFLTSSKQHELYIYLKDFNNEVRYAKYTNFSIGAQEENFELKSLGVYSGTAGDSMASNLNMQFSTTDKDHDSLTKIHCAQSCGSGWWFKGCGYSFLNGIYRRVAESKQKQGIEWHTWKLDSLKYVQMMIRPVD
ncbi:fibrinogen-like protein 1 [Drosophila hydei]|uniref:Fibrinogen-like protein 1 n=1 Tax=Drosophila hydei TaxID=7224 RepID=A0A6J1L4V2_DROHY|nr:fibrinogen-like protein 1 [Drosophila hydei]